MMREVDHMTKPTYEQLATALKYFESHEINMGDKKQRLVKIESNDPYITPRNQRRLERKKAKTMNKRLSKLKWFSFTE